MVLTLIVRTRQRPIITGVVLEAGDSWLEEETETPFSAMPRATER
jgi:hypothetical protein